MELRTLWLMLKAFLRLGVQGAQPVTVPEEARGGAVTATPARGADGWAVGWDTVLPGMRGHLVLAAGAGRQAMVPIQTASVAELLSKLQRLAQVETYWQQELPGDRPAGMVSLEGPDWTVYAWFSADLERLAYEVYRPGTGQMLSGSAPVWMLLEALLLCPDYVAVAQYLRLNSHKEPDFGTRM